MRSHFASKAGDKIQRLKKDKNGPELRKIEFNKI